MDAQTATDRVLEAYRAEYVRIGYMYSGEMSPEYLGRETGLGFDGALAAIKDLTAAGVLRKRECLAWTWELVPAERAKLIDAHGLAADWETRVPYFYPNHPLYGEIPHVLQECASPRR